MERTCLLFTTLILCSFSVLAQEKFNIDYDKFKDETTVKTKSSEVFESGSNFMNMRSIGFDARYYFHGKTQSAPVTEAFLVFKSSSSDWVYLRSHQLIFLADDARIDLGEAQHYGDVERGGVSERLTAKISSDQLAQIANAKKVEFQLGARSFKLRKEDLKRISGLLQKMSNKS